MNTSFKDSKNLEMKMTKLESEMKAELQELQNRVSICEQSPKQDEPLAFYAKLSTYRTFTYQSVIIFDEPVLNTGGGYNPTLGTFTCVEGIYFFSWTLDVNERDHDDRELSTLQLDGSVVAHGPKSSHDRHGSGNDYFNGSHTSSITMFCGQGQVVSLVADNSVGLFQDYTSFTGFQIS